MPGHSPPKRNAQKPKCNRYVVRRLRHCVRDGRYAPAFRICTARSGRAGRQRRAGHDSVSRACLRSIELGGEPGRFEEAGCGAGTVCPLRRSGRTARTTRVAAPRRAAATTAHSAEPQAKCRTPAATRPPVEPSTVEPSGSQRNVALSPALLWTLPPRLHWTAGAISCPVCSFVRLSCEHGDTDP